MAWSKDLVVWITGGGSGLGEAMALEFAAQGATIVVSGRRQDRLDAVVARIEAAGARGLALPCDVTDEPAVHQVAERIVAELGQLDVVVANAGFSVAGKVENLDASAWRRQFEVNVVGLTTTCAAAIPHLRASKGRLALIGSVASLAYLPGYGPYQASKAAVRAIGATLAAELAPEGISVTTLQPGFVESEIAKVDNDGVFDPDRKDKRPAALMWPTDKAARVMVRAIGKRKREFVFTGHGKFAAFIAQHFPSIVHHLGPKVA